MWLLRGRYVLDKVLRTFDIAFCCNVGNGI
jgi:hypothetical protein